MSRITVVGTGYVGLTTAACLADLGNEVSGVDVDDDRLAILARGEVPIYEPGLREITQRNRRAGRLAFTAVSADAISASEFVFIAVGTPMSVSGEADLTDLKAAAVSVASHIRPTAVIVNQSTVPIGTGDALSKIVEAHHHGAAGAFAVVSNPDFLREGSAVRDFMHPDRIVLGASDQGAAARVAELYRALNAPTLITNTNTAEMIKYASNAFLATKISFINEVARVCEKVDADVQIVAEGMGMDHRIGASFLEAGLGYGGSCLPKDVLALARTSEQIGAHPQLLFAVMEINRAQPDLLMEKVREAIGTLRDRVVGLLGLSFKPDTDDMREAPSLALASALLREGAIVHAYDPAAMPTAGRLLPNVKLMSDAYAVARNADALIVVTEWNEFRQLDMQRIRNLMRRPVVVDGRNIYEPDAMRAMGLVYRGVGR